VNLELKNPTGNLRLAAPTTAVFTIGDDDGPSPGMLQFDSPAYSVAESGVEASITVRRAGGSQGQVSVTYDVGVCSAPRCATRGSSSDFLLTRGTLTWAANETAAKSFVVSIRDDSLVEGDEVVSLVLTNPTGGAVLGTSSTTELTIADNDFPGTLQFSAARYSFDEGVGTATITVNRVGGRAGAVAVSYATAPAVASAETTPATGSDYTATSGTLRWDAGDASPKSFSVTITNDTTEENDETVLLALSNATGDATLGNTRPVPLVILDNDGPGRLQFSSASYSFREDVGSATITVQRVNGAKGAVSVNYATRSPCSCDGVPLDQIAQAGPAAGDSADYTHTAAGTLTFADGVTSQTFTVPIRDELVIENNEFLWLLLAPTGAAKLGTPASARLTIENDDALGQVQFAADDFPLWESDGATGVRLIRVGGRSGSQTVHAVLSGGTATTATATVDFSAAFSAGSGLPITFANGQTEQVVPLTINQDATQEPDETIGLGLKLPTAPAGWLFDRATATILDDDDPTWDKVTITAPDGDAAEPGTNTGSFELRRTRTQGALPVNLSVLSVAGSATNGVDYELLETSVLIAAGSPSKSLAVRPRNDSLVEGDETVDVRVAGGVGYSVGTPGTATVTIRDKQCRVRLRNITHNGASPISLGSTVTYTANLRNADPALANGEYTWKFRARLATGGYGVWKDVLDPSFANPVTVSANTMTVTENTVGRGQYQVTLDSCGEISTELVSVEIVPPSVSIGDVTVTEGNSGTVSAVFTVSLSSRSPQEVTVGYATVNNSAVAPGDFTAKTGTVRFPAGSTSRTIAVQVLGDTMYEPNERFFVDLKNPTGATLDSRRSRGTGTINNDDTQPTVAISPAAPARVTVTEGHAGTTAAQLTVTLSNASHETVSVKYSTTDQKAKQGSDYRRQQNTRVVFAPGETVKTIEVLIQADRVPETPPIEDFLVRLSDPSRATLGWDLAVVEIQDDDVPPVIAELNLLNDTGLSATDKITSDPTLTGRVTDDYSVAALSVEFDHNGDGAIEGFAYTDSRDPARHAERDQHLSGCAFRFQRGGRLGDHDRRHRRKPQSGGVRGAVALDQLRGVQVLQPRRRAGYRAEGVYTRDLPRQPARPMEVHGGGHSPGRGAPRAATKVPRILRVDSGDRNHSQSEVRCVC
jgi:hypothetical protein